MTSCDVLAGCPYMLDSEHAAPLLVASESLTRKVELLRRQGAVDEATLAALRKEWNVEQVYESAGIEGNTLTLNETKLAISRGITISGKPPEHVDEVVHLHEAHEFLEDLLKEPGPLTQPQLFEIQTLVLGREVPGAGEYRRVEVAIGNQKHKPPHPLKVSNMMRDYFTWLERAMPTCPVPLQASVAHAWLAHIHPFRDGNGRTARAIMNLLLMRAGFPVVIIRRKDRQRYYDALALSDEGDIGPVLELFVARAEDSLRQIDRVRRATTGISLEMERIAATEERAVALWNAAIDLLCEEVASALQQVVQEDPRYSLEWRKFDPIDRGDYHLLCGGHSISQSWVARFGLSRGARSFRFLLCAGFMSQPMTAFAGDSQPSLYLSEPNPEGYPQWRLPSAQFATTLREVAYVAGRFVVRREGSSPVVESSTTAFALHFVREVLRNTFA